MNSVNLNNNFQNFKNYNSFNKYIKFKNLYNNYLYTNQSSAKVDFKEGTSIVLKGLKDNLSNIVKTIVRHPIKTIVAIGITTSALAVLPFLGISMTTGSAVLTLGFGAFAIFNTAKNIYKARKNSKNGNYNELRKNLHNIGENIIDLTLTLPFIPKAIRHLKRNVPLYFQKDLILYKKGGKIITKVRKYMGGRIFYTYNPDGTIKSVKKSSLFTKIKKAKTWNERFNLFFKQDKTEKMYNEINKAYRQIAKERDIYSAQDIKFKSIVQEIDLSGKEEICSTEGWVDSGKSNVINLNVNDFSQQNFFKKIGHEHRHIEQNEMMARAGFYTEKDFLPDIIKKGKIKAGTTQYYQAKDFLHAFENYPQNNSINNPLYKFNLLEIDARDIGEKEIANQIRMKFLNNQGYKNIPKGATFESVLKHKYAKEIILPNGIVVEKVS